MRSPAYATLLALSFTATAGCRQDEPTAGKIEGPGLATETVAKRAATQRRSVGPESEPEASPPKQILFGDLHVHSTFSVDAFIYSLPVFNGEGAHPPADACDFARHCARLDFFAITDHAEGLTPHLWEETKESIRQCNDVAGDPENPDLVAFVGWEWTQAGRTPETHYGHKNVIFRSVDEAKLPKRPISSIDISTYEEQTPPTFVLDGAASATRLLGYDRYADVISFIARLSDQAPCPAGVPSPDLPADCREAAVTPAELFAKLDEWGFESLVIPHGLAWGIHAPPGARLDVQLTRAQHDESRQRLIEIWSGHGNSEEFRDVPEYVVDANGRRVCPEPTKDFLPCCWRAGELMRARCGDLPEDECERRVEEAKLYALEGGVSPDLVFPDTRGDDWLDCDQCRDCFKPAMTIRPGVTAQYGAAITSFDEVDEQGRPLRFRWGFISSTDNHSARPGTGYKQVARKVMSDVRGLADEETEGRVRGWFGPAQEEAGRAQAVEVGRMFDLFDTERKSSFLYPGGIVAVHADGRSRDAIWDALQRREVYGTSGPRMLLWFDLLNAPVGTAPMGSEVTMAETPRFRVRAVGAFRQRPGCPEEAERSLSQSRLDALCRDECDYPSDERHPIRAIEVVRIRPQATRGEAVATLIEDPWLRLECGSDPAGCQVEFDDPEFASSARDAVYYVRALQEPTPAVNGAGLRTELDGNGNAVRISQCHGGPGTDESDDCLAPVQERAWSSPVYVDQPATKKPARESS